MKILLVEDDDVLIQVLTRSLAPYHYIVDTVKDGEMGWTYGSTFEYDLIVLDVVLPKLDGISLCKRFRAEGYLTPILLLTAQDTITAKVQGFDAGADDYVVKPFNQTELTARIRALLRRGSMNPSPLLSCGDLLLNLSTCEVSYRGEPLTLTTKEYELLELLLRDSQHVFSSEELLDRLWSSEAFPSEATVRSHIRRLRRKLVTVGASPDLIATMHGRGYYLKAAGKEEATQRSAKALQATSASHTTPLSDRPTGFQPSADLQLTGSQSPAAQQQYLAFLNETWTTTKPKSLDQVAILAQAVSDLQTDRLDPQQQVQAQQAAHQLAGTLGILGLAKAMHLARQLEHWLGSHEPLQPKQAPLINTLVTALQQQIVETTQIQMSQILQEHAPLLLAVSADAGFNQALASVAAAHGLRFDIMLPDTAQELMGAEGSGAKPPFAENQQPDVLLFRFPAHLAEALNAADTAESVPEFNALLATLQAFANRYPALPILVMGDRSKLNDCLEVMRRGGKLFLDSSTQPEQVLIAAVNVLRGSQKPTRVMIVDDDRTWLRTLPTLLKPWGFTVTTLADPEQFWAVLQASTPDALVLDVKMPQIDGFELCQILRSDPNWQRLPVLFLSVLTDSASQNQAFTVGADDYLCKPVKGVELANRILSRLQRVRAWAS